MIYHASEAMAQTTRYRKDQGSRGRGPHNKRSVQGMRILRRILPKRRLGRIGGIQQKRGSPSKSER